MDNKIIKFISGAISTSLLFESCANNYYVEGPADEINRIIENTASPQSSIIIPIEYKINDIDTDYIKFLASLAEDISNNPAVAKKFLSNPQKYIRSKGFNIEYSRVSPKLTLIILALADEEICAAISEENIPEYLELMKEKGLINDIVFSTVSEAEKYNKLDIFSLEKRHNDEDPVDLNSALFFPYIVVGVAVAIWAVAVEHVFAGNAVTVGTVFTYLAAVSTKTLGNRSTNNRVYEKVIQNNALEVYYIKSPNLENLNIVADKYIELSVDSTIGYLKRTYPDAMKNINISNLKKAILLNINNSIYE